MTDETIVAVFSDAENVAAVISDLESIGIPSSGIVQHSSETGSDTSRSKGFWEKLFGAYPKDTHDTAAYNHAITSGSTVLTIQCPSDHASKVIEILEDHEPTDIDEMVKNISENSGKADVIPLSDETSDTHAINNGTSTVRHYVIEQKEKAAIPEGPKSKSAAG